MATRMERVRERVDLCLYDTVFASELKPDFSVINRAEGTSVAECRLFGPRNLGIGMLSNLMVPNQFPGDQSAIVKYVFAKLWFDENAEGARHYLDSWEANTLIGLTVGARQMLQFPLTPCALDLERVPPQGDMYPDGFPSLRNYRFDLGVNIHIPARQYFDVTVTASLDAIHDVEEFPGRKLFRVWLFGDLIRDIT